MRGLITEERGTDADLQGFRVRVFFGEGAEGNAAHCMIVHRRPGRSMAARLSSQLTDPLCFCWWRRGALQVRCFNGGKLVRFCGHGILACAYLWRRMQRNHVDQSPHTYVHRLKYGCRNCEYFERNDAAWVRSPRVPSVVVPLPPDIARYVQPTPTAMAHAGGSKGYRLFEWPAGTDIAMVAIDPQWLSTGGRATIFTARENIKSQTDFTLRYFAPQYGVDEDSATGSANAVLADYWQQQGFSGPFRGRQRSQAGGVILSAIESTTVVAIGGAVTIESASTGDDSQ